MEDVKAFFLCNRKKCPNCSPQCSHTSDYRYAMNPEGKYKKVLDGPLKGAMVQMSITDTIIFDDKFKQVRKETDQ